MMSRGKFMVRTSMAIDELVMQLALEPAARSDVRGRMARYNRDCGCAFGGAFMIASLVLVVIYIAVTGSVSFSAIGAGVGFVIVSSMLGKAAGLALASVRLGLLRGSLVRRARHQERDDRVRVH